MKYITGIYLPKGIPGQSASCRFARRGLKSVHKSVELAIEKIERSQSVAGDDFTIFVDEKLQKHKNGKLAWDIILKSNLNVTPISNLPEDGFWCKKWNLALNALNIFGEPVLWLDFMDAEILETFSDEEVDFLNNGRDIVCEWERFRVFGEPMHNKDGSVCLNRRQYQPQTSIYYLTSEEVPKMALNTGIDHDQISLGHVAEKKYGIYQDEIEGCYNFSSCGLFVTSTKPSNNCITNKNKKFKCKITHK